MKILITAGGTRVPIDDVRYVGNFSRGTFGSNLVESFLSHTTSRFKPYVHHLRATDALKPVIQSAYAKNLQYGCTEFRDYWDYASKLEKLVRNGRFDMVLLAAAVSDYGPDPIEGKISSDQDELVIRMKRLPKLINKVKEWDPDIIQVGFKLLSNVSEDELVETALNAGQKAGSHMTIANDLQSIKDGRHKVYLVDHMSGSSQYYMAAWESGRNALIQAMLNIYHRASYYENIGA